MNLLFICESFPESEAAELTGGVETGDFYLVKELGKHHQITVLTGARVGSPRKTEMYGATIYRLGKKVSANQRESLVARLSFALNAIQFQTDFDVVYASNFFTHALAAIVSWRSKKPGVIKTADVYLGSWIKHAGIFTGLIGEILERLTLKYPWKTIISWSESTKKKLRAVGVKHRIEVIGGAAEPQSSDTVTQWHGDTASPTLVCVSRLVKYKRVEDVIKAFDLVKRTLPDAQLKIIGSGPELPHLQQLALILGISESVEFIGFVKSHKKVLEYVKKSQLLIHASEVEGFGLVTLEALACGVPYVHSNLDVTKEITDGGKGGKYFEVGNYQEAAEQVIELLSSKTSYNQKIKEAEVVTKKHSWSQVAKETEVIFQKAIEKN